MAGLVVRARMEPTLDCLQGKLNSQIQNNLDLGDFSCTLKSLGWQLTMRLTYSKLQAIIGAEGWGFDGFRDDIPLNMLLFADKTPTYCPPDHAGSWYRLYISFSTISSWMRSFPLRRFVIGKGASLSVLPRVSISFGLRADFSYVAVANLHLIAVVVVEVSTTVLPGANVSQRASNFRVHLSDTYLATFSCNDFSVRVSG